MRYLLAPVPQNYNYLNINAIMPAIITGVVAIVGFLVQIIINLYTQYQNKRANKINTLNTFLIPLQKMLMEISTQMKFANLTLENLVLCVIGVESCSENIRVKSISIYQEISLLFLKGNYYYIDRKVHKYITKIRKHTYNVISILESSNLPENKMKEIIGEISIKESDYNNLISYIDELQKKM